MKRSRSCILRRRLKKMFEENIRKSKSTNILSKLKKMFKKEEEEEEYIENKLRFKIYRDLQYTAPECLGDNSTADSIVDKRLDQLVHCKKERKRKKKEKKEKTQ